MYEKVKTSLTEVEIRNDIIRKIRKLPPQKAEAIIEILTEIKRIKQEDKPEKVIDLMDKVIAVEKVLGSKT